jgi:hypothetical protein
MAANLHSVFGRTRAQYKWFYLAFMNGVWVAIPAVLLWDSALRHARTS